MVSTEIIKNWGGGGGGAENNFGGAFAPPCPPPVPPAPGGEQGGANAPPKCEVLNVVVRYFHSVNTTVINEC